MDFNSVFDANPTVTKLYGFEDGNAFVKQSEADAYKKSSGKEYKVIDKKESVSSKPDNEDSKHKKQK